MRLSLVRTPCSQSHNPHCVPIIQEKWKFSFVGTAMKDVNPFFGTRQSGRGPAA